MNKSNALPLKTHIFWTVNLIIVTFIWGITFVLVKDAIQVIQPITFIFLRFFGTTLFSLFTLRFLYRSMGLQDLLFNRKGWLLGLLLFIAFYFQTVGLNYTTPGNAAFVTSLYVPFVPLFLLVIYKKNIHRLIYIWTLFAAVGLALLSLNFSNLTVNVGDILIIITAVMFALQIIKTSKFSESTAEGALIFSQFLSTTSLSLIVLFLSRFFSTKSLDSLIVFKNILDTSVIFALIVTIFFATLYAFYVQTAAQHREIPAEYIALIFSFEPVFALVTSILVGDENLPLQKIIGAILIFISLLGTTLYHTSKIKEEQEVFELT